MDNIEFEIKTQPLERATANRLSKLQSMAVDTSRLEQMIASEISAPLRRHAYPFPQWGRPLSAVAASFLTIVALAALFIGMSERPVVAAPTEMARFHEDIVSGLVKTPEIDSVEIANRALAVQWAQPLQAPNLPADHFMACCMRSMKNRKVACVLLKDSNEPVTITVANASDMGLPTSAIQTRNNIAYHVQSVGTLHMVMTERNGQWICLIANLPVDHMMDLASSIKF
ncbi:MAG: hypothetical protein M3O30_00525 [Planctomycetota bacterium]|nr:hypothetical protein [Planctomycetota bacterium]